jgi:hypothetical protein
MSDVLQRRYRRLLLLLTWRPPAARPWPWLLAVPAAVFLLPTQFDATLRDQPWAFGVVLLVCLLWTVADARPALGAAGLVLAFLAWLLSYLSLAGDAFHLWYWLAGEVTVTVAGSLRGTATLSRPTGSQPARRPYSLMGWRTGPTGRTPVWRRPARRSRRQPATCAGTIPGVGWPALTCEYDVLVEAGLLADAM